MDTATYTKITGWSPQLVVADTDRPVEFDIKKNGLWRWFFVMKTFMQELLKRAILLMEKRKQKQPRRWYYLFWDGIEDLYEEILDKSAEITQPFQDMRDGKECYITGLGGNMIAFFGQV